MTSYLQKQIKDRISSKNITVYSLEKKTGLNKSAIKNIMSGLSRNASVTTLNAIALALNCDLTGLILLNENHKEAFASRNKAVSKSLSKPPLQKKYIWNEALYLESVKTVSDLASNKELNLNVEQITSLLNESYKYSINKNSQHIDKDFCIWLINRSF